MLVLARCIGEVLHIQTPKGVVKVVVMGIDDYLNVQLGVHASREIKIVRGEQKDKPSHSSNNRDKKK